ncbi:putative Antibiotic biosynthesis monooxygenase [Vibrio nigripulchritudo SOn1]|uniref:Antibiotic biosynthesis monooxygenase n=1 Tax=Vibrio nigripulchritudo SOn1 TaxID=1238450 RepID=A0AAV2VSA2_9VIBR|nr:putative quinol monooxygenase [Vibrio nigripulchritudo]BDU40956.1 antibiotic biosynthesis monooxygenase [Vibrio nigripulchritudo]BDU46696.1 antibiotic biosynthesis monooxygenase [Vibrio nigripulchritudo]CCO47507.1 putative Antibiotic biosynthesis monooxygenase [Vibrio nigripulchritudo SOn1]
MKTLCISAGLSLSSDAPREYVLEEARKLVAETVKEPGCQHFELLERQDDPTKFTLWERWDSEEDLNNHFEQPHTKTFLAQNLTKVEYIEKLYSLSE